jgi:hypothetical protein
MQTDPSTITSSTNIDNSIDPTAQMATGLVTNYVTTMADKVQKAIEIVFGPNAKKYGVSAKNLELAFMVAGILMLTPKVKIFLFGDNKEKVKGKWLPVFGTLLAIIAVRKYYEGKDSVIANISPTITPLATPSPVTPSPVTPTT